MHIHLVHHFPDNARGQYREEVGYGHKDDSQGKSPFVLYKVLI